MKSLNLSQITLTLIIIPDGTEIIILMKCGMIVDLVLYILKTFMEKNGRDRISCCWSH